jgi:hypothetical protein
VVFAVDGRANNEEVAGSISVRREFVWNKLATSPGLPARLDAASSRREVAGARYVLCSPLVVPYGLHLPGSCLTHGLSMGGS